MPPKVIQHSDYKKFDYAILDKSLPKQIENLNFTELDFAKYLVKYLCKFLDKFAPLKKKYIRANHSKFVNLVKLSMLRSKLRNQFLKTKTEES